MNIAGYKFHLFTGPTLCGTPGVLIYIHQASGKCFVRVMRNVRKQRGKNNYPTPLKEMLKIHTSEVLVYIADVPKDTKEALHQASRTVRAHLTAKGVLYKNPRTKNDSDGQSSSVRYTVWKLTHRRSGAVYYFEEVKGVDVLRRIAQRIRTFNNYVEKNLVNANRVMYHFAKKYFPLVLGSWTIEDLDLELPGEKEALLHITTLSKQHLENNVAVLNRINNTDALYYRNTILKLPHIGIDDYLP